MRILWLVSLAALAACGPPSGNERPKVFEPFPAERATDFACALTLVDADSNVFFGTDKASPREQAFAYFGRETLRLTSDTGEDFEAGDTRLTYRAYDYQDFRLDLELSSPNGEAFTGTAQMMRRDGEAFVPMTEAVAVTGTCGG